MFDREAHHQREPERELRERFHRGEAEAMEELAQAFFDDVLRYAKVVMAGEEAFEAVQETFLRMLERHRLYDPQKPFRPWLFTLCRNCCTDLLRRRGRQRARVVELAEPDDGGAALDERPDTRDNPVESLIREQDVERLRAALATLPEHKRTIVMLHVFEELTFREVAAIVGLPPPTVSTTYYRTLTELRALLAAPERSTSRVC